MMVRVFGHYVPAPILMLAALDALILLIALYAGLYFRWTDLAMPLAALETHLPRALLFTFVISLMMFAVGLYERQIWSDLVTVIARVIISFAIAFLFLSFIFYLFPDVTIWRSAFIVAVAIAIVAIAAVRILYFKVVDLEAFKRRILVLGAGNHAARIHALESNGRARGFYRCVGYIPVNGGAARIPHEYLITGVNNLADFVERQDVEEIVVAVDDRRGRVPVQALLDCKLNGINVIDFLSFYEREAGRVDLAGLNPSWIIFADHKRSTNAYDLAKRNFDIVVSLAFLVFILPLLIATAVAIRVDSRGPILYRQERVGRNGRRFNLLKFRSMRVDAERDGVPQWAGKRDPRITRVGRLIRRTRIDELPQLFNVLRGDMGLVGPRPERPFFVDELCRKIPFYAERHRVKPGLTGWAQINYQYAASITDSETKTEYDLYYVKNHNLFLDLIIILQTLRVIIWPPGVH